LAAASSAKAAVGQPAPDFKLKDALGKVHSLSEHKGRIVVLEWTNKECPYVVAHHEKQKTTQKAYAKYAPKGVIWLAVDTTSWCKPEANRVWSATHRIAYPILHDPTGEVGHMYGAKTTPHMFVINKDGTLVYAGAIDDRKGENYVTAALDALLAGKAPPKSETKPYGCSVKYAKRTAKATGGNGGNGDKAKAVCAGCPKAGKCPVAKACCGSDACPPSGCGAEGKTAKAKTVSAKGGNGGNGGGCCPAKRKPCCGG